MEQTTWLIILTLSQALLLAMRIVESRHRSGDNRLQKTNQLDTAERLARMEALIETMREDIAELKCLVKEVNSGHR